jgi:hypothetical protein
MCVDTLDGQTGLLGWRETKQDQGGEQNKKNQHQKAAFVLLYYMNNYVH